MLEFFYSNYAASLSFFVIFTLMVGGLATLLSKLAVALRDKAHLPNGVVGGILIGAITSVPELISAIVSVTVYKSAPSGIFGDAIGSNMFCLFILGACLLICVWIFRDKTVNQMNTVTLGLTGLGGIMCFFAGLFADGGLLGSPSPLVWHGFNFFSIPILLCYAAAVVFMVRGVGPKTTVLPNGKILTKAQIKAKKARATAHTILPAEHKNRFYKLSMPMLILSLVVTAAALIAGSIVLASCCSALIEQHWGLPQIFGRTLILGIATSLPELICLVSLAVGKEFDLLLDSIVGSVAFNMCILFIGNIAVSCVWDASWIGHSEMSMYSLSFENPALIAQLIVFVVQTVLMVIYFVLNSQTMKIRFTKGGMIAINATFLSLIVAAYLIYIIMGIVLLK